MVTFDRAAQSVAHVCILVQQSCHWELGTKWTWINYL